MKTKLVTNKETETPKIDWNKPNLLTDGKGTMYVISTGYGANDECFSGVVVHDKEGILRTGHYCSTFGKDSWQLVTDEVTITFNAK